MTGNSGLDRIGKKRRALIGGSLCRVIGQRD